MRIPLRRIPALRTVQLAAFRPVPHGLCSDLKQYRAESTWTRSVISLSIQGKPELAKKPELEITSTPFKPSLWEAGWMDYWKSHGCFEPMRWDENREELPLINMLLPPPNVTGQLHLGHALMLGIQDTYARYYRMKGHPVIWRPGTDHAGIATQTAVERYLKLQRREDLGRDELVKEIEKWTETYGNTILKQMEKMGASTTDSKRYYTLDNDLSEAVGRAFVQLHEEGLIYRDTRMVNWSVGAGTALSDIEVEMLDVQPGMLIDGVEFGRLHTIAYKIEGEDREIEVSTTRPETIFGDRAIAVHPEDERYKDLHYKFAIHPLIHIKIPIIPDAELVDPELGTGAVKITPAHDLNDYEFWKRHSAIAPKNGSSAEEVGNRRVTIGITRVFGQDGKMLPKHATLKGMDRLKARPVVVKMLQGHGAYRGSTPHHMRVAKCSRTGSIIEPLLCPQWYLKTKPLAANVLSLSLLGDEQKQRLVICPPDFQDEWQRWLFDIKDWCLSRQIWWGHRVPAWRVVSPVESPSSLDVEPDATEETAERWIVALTEEEARKKLHPEERHCKLVQDEDVLDTWFSSGLLPLTTAGWTGIEGQKKEEWNANYPLKFIESGNDILFFWLARMAMLCSWFSGKMPFNEILLHPLVCDSNGRKMSKSVGNVVDPIAIVEGRTAAQVKATLQQDSKEELAIIAEREKLADFWTGKDRADKEAQKAAKKAEAAIAKRIKEVAKKYSTGIVESGADALRLALIDYTKQQTINFDQLAVDNYRKLVIKILNVFKFYMNTRKTLDRRFKTSMVELELPAEITGSMLDKLAAHDLYMLYHLRKLTQTCNQALNNRRLHEVPDAIRKFVFDHFANLYIEWLKPELDSDDKERAKTAYLIMSFAFDTLLRLSHPFMPFLSETLWQSLNPNGLATSHPPVSSSLLRNPPDEIPSTIMLRPYPVPPIIDSKVLDPVNSRGIRLVAQLMTKLSQMIALSRRPANKKPSPYSQIDWKNHLIKVIVMGESADREIVSQYTVQVARNVKLGQRLEILNDKQAEEVLGGEEEGEKVDWRGGLETWVKDPEVKRQAHDQGGMVEVNMVGKDAYILFWPALRGEK